MLREEISTISDYMQTISPKLEKYKTLKKRRSELQATLKKDYRGDISGTDPAKYRGKKTSSNDIII